MLEGLAPRIESRFAVTSELNFPTLEFWVLTFIFPDAKFWFPAPNNPESLVLNSEFKFNFPEDEPELDDEEELVPVSPLFIPWIKFWTFEPGSGVTVEEVVGLTADEVVKFLIFVLIKEPGLVVGVLKFTFDNTFPVFIAPEVTPFKTASDFVGDINVAAAGIPKIKVAINKFVFFLFIIAHTFLENSRNYF